MKLVDAPVSGGVKRAAEGTLTVRTSKIYTQTFVHIPADSIISVLSENPSEW